VFASFMVNTWWVASIVAVVAGLVGFFVVLRGAAFAAHAIPQGAFAGAAGASLLGVNVLIGLGAFSLLGALGIGGLARHARRDVATALTLSFMLGLGALFLSLGSGYASQLLSLLFGEVLGISSSQLVPTLALALLSLVVLAALYRPLLMSSVLDEVAEARGIGPLPMEMAFLAVVALATTMTVPVVGTLLIFSLMVGAPAAARCLTDRPSRALGLSVALALLIVWAAIAASYLTDYPIGFFVGCISAVVYSAGRAWSGWHGRPTRARW
jgi:zinc/manganese transport system permease protein